MRFEKAFLGVLFFLLGVFVAVPTSMAQTGNSANVSGIVTDPSGAVVAGANVTIHNPVTGFERSATTDASGNFSFANVPFNPYHMAVSATGFGPFAQDIDVRSSVPLALKIHSHRRRQLQHGYGRRRRDLLENEPTFHTDVDRALVRQASPRERVFVGQFARYACYPGRRRGFQWPVPRTRRSRGEFVFR